MSHAKWIESGPRTSEMYSLVYLDKH